MNVKLQCIVTAISILMVCAGSSLAATRTWKNNMTGDWFTAVNWNEGAVPVAGDDVVITNTGAYVILSSSTEINLSSLTLSKTLMFTNWDSALNATNVTILTNGTMTLPAAFTNTAISNNIYIECASLTISNGGSINVDYKGYTGGGAVGTTGHGPGGGVYNGSGSSGGGYGGNGGYGYSPSIGGSPYGSSDIPQEPGSGGGGANGANPGGSGGGAIQINASGTVTVNGTITAQGGVGSWNYGGGGSGGSIYIACNKLVGTNGIIKALGGSGGSGSGGGGGGRITVIYNQTAQSNEPVQDIKFSAAAGAGGTSSSGDGDIGTLYFPDSRFLTENITHVGQWMVTTFTNWSVNSLMLSNRWIRFPAEGFRLTVTNDVTIMGSAGRLDLGHILWTRLTQFSDSTNCPVLNIGGNLTLTNGGDLYVYSGMTNASTTNYGALVSVTNDVFIASTTCWIYAYSHWTNGGSPLFRMHNLFVSTNAGFSANAKGHVWGYMTKGYGPGGGAYHASGSAGGGYGGKGGNGYSSTPGGSPYGSSNAPVDPGSGGAGGSGGVIGNVGGSGGGAIQINASGTVTVNGTLTAYGGGGSWNYGSGGSGGAIYITARTFAGTNCILRAYGGGGGSASGGGGGGRIAVWRVFDETSGTIQTNVAGGTGNGASGEAGTVVWGWLPPARTVIRLY